MTRPKGSSLSFRTLYESFWNSPEWKILPPGQPSSRALLMYLAVGPLQRAVPGVLFAGEGEIADRLGWSQAQVRKCMGPLLGNGSVQIDPAARLIWLPWRYDHEPPANPDVVRGVTWRSVFERWPRGDLADRVCEDLRRRLAMRGPEFLAAFDSLPHDGDAPSPPTVSPHDGDAPSPPTPGGHQRSNEAEKQRSIEKARAFSANTPANESTTNGEPQREAETGKDRQKAVFPDWPPGVLAQLHQALDAVRLPEAVWKRFVAESMAFPVAQRVAAARKYIAEKHPPGEHSPAYVIAMIRDGAGGGHDIPKWKQLGFPSEAAMQEKARTDQERLEADLRELCAQGYVAEPEPSEGKAP